MNSGNTNSSHDGGINGFQYLEIHTMYMEPVTKIQAERKFIYLYILKQNKICHTTRFCFKWIEYCDFKHFHQFAQSKPTKFTNK